MDLHANKYWPTEGLPSASPLNPNSPQIRWRHGRTYNPILATKTHSKHIFVRCIPSQGSILRLQRLWIPLQKGLSYVMSASISIYYVNRLLFNIITVVEPPLYNFKHPLFKITVISCHVKGSGPCRLPSALPRYYLIYRIWILSANFEPP